MSFRDEAEAQVDRWRDTFFDAGATALLARLPEEIAVCATAGAGPALVLDVGEVVELADVFCLLGLRRDDVGGASLAAARACYREVERWPRPWPAGARRSDISTELQRSTPRRLHPTSLALEIEALERAQAAAIDERPWILADLHWDKLKKEWGYAIQEHGLPSLDGPASLTVQCADGLAELGALLATVALNLQADFVEATDFTRDDRTGLARELVDRVRPGARRYATYLRAELARLHPADPRTGACRAALALLDPAG